jgi:hypothetical protein
MLATFKSKKIATRAQEVVTIFSDIPHDATMKNYAELDEWFNVLCKSLIKN